MHYAQKVSSHSSQKQACMGHPASTQLKIHARVLPAIVAERSRAGMECQGNIVAVDYCVVCTDMVSVSGLPLR